MMRHLQAVLLALAMGVMGCCGFLDTAREITPPSDPQRLVTAASPGQSFVIDVALLERPRGDHFLNQELWELGNEQGIALELKPVLEEYGLRVGQIGGLLPPRLQALMSSKRSCPDPRRLRGDPDLPTPVQIGTPHARLTYQDSSVDPARVMEFEDAVCYFEVTPSTEGQDGIRLAFKPVIRHGKPRIAPRVERDAEGTLRWSVEAREHVEEFPQLAWEMNLSTDEYVLIGARLDQPRRLGESILVSPDGRTQRLMILRVLRLDSQGVDETLSQAPPLALQASWTARGSRR